MVITTILLTGVIIFMIVEFIVMFNYTKYHQKLMKKKYKLYSIKLAIEGEFDNEEKAIKELADDYMRCSKVNPPGESIGELLCQEIIFKAEDIGKVVRLAIYEENKYGISQWNDIKRIKIYPFKDYHWDKTVKYHDFKPPQREFKYEVRNK